MRPGRWGWIGLLVLAVVWAAGADDRPIVEIAPGKARAFRTAVQEFMDELAVADSVEARSLRVAIEDALEFSGAMLPLDRAAYLAPEKTVELQHKLRDDCIDWTQSGADVVLEGRIRRGGSADSLAVDFQVWDTARCSMLMSDTVERSADELQRIGKEIADLASAAFTGIRGVSNTEISFVSNRTGRREVYVMEADGSASRRATNSPAIKSFPSWYVDGSAIAFTSHRDGRQPALALSSRGKLAAGPFLFGILPGAPKYRGVFGPNGDFIAFVTSVDQAAEIFSVRRDGKKLRRLTHSSAIEVSPAWSPDGERMAFVSDRTGSPQVYVMDKDGRNARRLTFQGSYNTGPSWSPDGRWIAYETRLESQFDIWLIDPEGEVNFPLIEHPRSDETPSWAPNSRKLAFSSTRRGHADLYVIDLTGENLRRLTRNEGDNIQPSWGPHPE